jgi:FeS assembly SUF system protein
MNVMLTEQTVVNALKTIYDPEIPVNIYDLGLIYDVKIDGDKVLVLMTLTTATCPAAAFMPEEVKTVLLEIEGVAEANVEVTYEPKWTRDRMSETAKEELGFY